jgi:hypothetical protein
MNETKYAEALELRVKAKSASKPIEQRAIHLAKRKIRLKADFHNGEGCTLRGTYHVHVEDMDEDQVQLSCEWYGPYGATDDWEDFIPKEELWMDEEKWEAMTRERIEEEDKKKKRAELAERKKRAEAKLAEAQRELERLDE